MRLPDHRAHCRTESQNSISSSGPTSGQRACGGSRGFCRMPHRLRGLPPARLAPRGRRSDRALRLVQGDWSALHLADRLDHDLRLRTACSVRYCRFDAAVGRVFVKSSFADLMSAFGNIKRDDNMADLDAGPRHNGAPSLKYPIIIADDDAVSGR